MVNGNLQSSISNNIYSIIAIVIGIALLPVLIQGIAMAQSMPLDQATKAILGLVPLIYVVGLVAGAVYAMVK